MTCRSMTAMASGTGADGGFSWTWDMRSVNARGLDLRLRVPDWIGGLEHALRTTLQGALARGSVSVTLRLVREDEATGGAEDGALDLALARIARVQARAARTGMSLAPVTANDVLALARETGPRTATPQEVGSLRTALEEDFARGILPPFQAMRAAEGATIATALAAQIETVSGLVDDAQRLAAARGDRTHAALSQAMARVAGNVQADPDRIAQELALLAVKADITEEIDRLRGHVAAARGHLSDDGPKGRKLDFLSQEFNREANTLCAKSQDPDLTATGLALKGVIDQMREQVQNLE